MPRDPQPLPEDLVDRAFLTSDLGAAGLSPERGRRSDLAAPYRGVRTRVPPRTLIEHCRAYAPRLRPGQVFSHVTAAGLHGLPLPSRLESMHPLHIAVVRPASPPRIRGVEGHRLAVTPVRSDLDGLPVCAPSEVWVQLAPDLSLDEAVEMADHLLTVSPLPPERSRAVLERRIRAVRRATAPMLLEALALARCPVLSPGETRVRLLLVRAGLPEPEVDGKVFDAAGGYLGKPDLLWREARLGLEYEGGGHAERKQIRIDIERREAFHDAGWDLLRVSSDDLDAPERRTALVSRVRRRIGR